MATEDIRLGSILKHKEAGRTPHIVIYMGMHTEAGERLVVHRPLDKIEVIYCEPVESFLGRFE